MLRFYRFICTVVILLAFLALKPHISFSQCTISNLDASYCTNDAPIALTAGSATNFVGAGVAAGIFDPSLAGPGTHTIVANDRASSYSVLTSGTFNRISPPGSETTLSLGKDTDSGILSIGNGFFDFDFFGTTYTQLRIGSNGLIGLGAGVVTSATNQNLPSGTVPDNIIAAIWGDMTGTGTIKYWTIGTAPYRVFVVDFDLVRTGGLYSVISQVQLYESTNIIEIHTQAAPFATNGDLATQGIENIDGSVAYAVIGRNDALWNATNDYKAFVPICLDSKEVTVYAVPSVLLNVTPAATTVCTNSAVDITIENSEIGFLYQLQDNGSSDPLSGFYPGTGLNLVIPSDPITGATTIKVYARNTSSSSCDGILTDLSTISLDALPVITVQPIASQSICEGSAANFSVTATGTGLSYQWKKNGIDIGGATLDTYSIGLTATADGGTYTVVVSGTCSPGVTSTASVLIINQQPEILTGPASQTVCAGQSVTFTVNAGVTTGVTYQWRKGGVNIGGAISSSYTIPVTVAGDAGSFDVVVSGTCTPGVTSAAATLTIDALPVITVQPIASQSICEGSAANFSVTATGTGLSYQWKKNGIDIGGATLDTYSIGLTATADGGTYTVVVSGTCSPSVTSTASVLIINQQPEILTGPASQTVCAGQSVTFTVNAGVTTGVTYQWRKGGVNIGGAISSSYTIPVTVAGDAGSFDVVVSGTCTPGVTSAAATLTIDALPVITVQPIASQSICEGSAANFSVTATGTGLSYQWKKNGIDIGGATLDTYSIGLTATADGGTYTVVVSGTCSPGVTSTASVLIINQQPEILTGPASQTVCAGQSVTFTVNAGVTTGVTYQWRKGGVNIGGAISSSYTIPVTVAGDAGSFDVVVSGTCTPGVTSAAATLTIDALPVITVQPIASQSICEGSAANFSVTATGTGLSYQWKKNGIDIGGATLDTYSIGLTATADGGTYTVVVSGTCSPGVTSTASVLIINQQPEILTGPASQTVCAGQSVTFTVNAGVTTGVTYQWRKGGVNIGGAISSSYTIPVTVAGDAGSFDVVVSGTCTPGVTSAAATLTIDALPVITLQPLNSTICEGANTSFTVNAGITTLPTYQWQVSTNSGVSYTNLSDGGIYGGSTTATLSLTVAPLGNNGYLYRAIVSGTCAPSVPSDGALLTVNANAVISTQPATIPICEESTVQFNVVATGTGLTYQWREDGLNISDGGIYSGSTSAILTLTNVPSTFNGRQYDVVISGACLPETSSAATLSVNEKPEITLQPINSTICEGSNTSFTVSAGVTTSPTYQWQVSTNGGVSYLNLSDAGIYAGTSTATLNLTITPLANNGYIYRAIVGGSCSPGVASDGALLTVNANVVINTQPATATICENGTVDFSVVATGTGLSYQWREGGLDIADGGIYSGSTSATLTLSNVPITFDGRQYDVVINGTCIPLTSSAATLNVNRNPDAFASDASICSGQTTAINITNPNVVPGTTFTWSIQSANNVTGASVGAGNLIAQTLTSTDGVTTGIVTYLIQPSAAGCNGSAYAVSVTVTPIPDAAASPQTICSGTSTSVAITNPNGVSGTTFSWTVFSATNVLGASTGSGETISQVLTSFDGITSGTVTYRITPTVSGCQGNSIDVLVTVSPRPVITNTPTSLLQEICSGTSLNFLPTSSIGGTSYNWTSSVIGTLTGVALSGSGAIMDTPINSTNSNAVIIYNIAPVFSGCIGDAVNMVVTVRPVPTATALPQTICSGQSTSVSITNPNSVSGTTFSWTVLSSTNVAEASGGSGNIISQVLTSSDGLTDGTVIYRIMPSVNGCPGPTYDVVVTVKPVPVITNSPVSLSQQICSEVALSFVPTATIPGSTFSWTSSIVGTIDPASVSVSGSGTITDTPVNTGNVSGTVTYHIIPEFNSCQGLPVDLVVIVKPLPSAIASDITVCSGETALITIFSTPQNVAGTTFTWTAAPSFNVIGATDGNGSTIGQVLSTTDASVGTVVYTITPNANACDGPTFNVTVTVNPIPTVDAGTDFALCNPVTIPISGTIGGSATSATWTESGAGFISPTVVSGSTVTATYTVAAADLDGFVTFTLTTNDPSGPCLAVSDQVVVKVNSLPAVFISGLETVYAENSGVDALDGFPLGGIFTGPGILAGTNIFNPANAGHGVVTIRYTYTDPLTSCTNFTERTTIVNPVTVADFYILEDNRPNANGFPQICADQDDLTLIGIPPVSAGIFPTIFRGLSPELIPRITFDATNWKLDTDGLLAGTYQLQYIFTNTSFATDTVTKDLIVFSSPLAIIDVGDNCIEDVITFTESSTIPNNLSSGSIISWNWLFGEDSNGSNGPVPEPQYSYIDPGPKSISLEVLTDQGCTNKASKNIIIGKPPVANFSWSDFCKNDVTKFKDESESEFGVINSYVWDFGDGQSAVLADPDHSYANFGVYDVTLTVGTTAGCSGDTTKRVYILDLKTPSRTEPYSTNFENGPQTWVPGTANSSWIFGLPGGENLNTAYSGSSAWWTGGNTNSYFNNEESFVIGPCLNLTELKRPMISLKYWADVQGGFDGAVVQYSTNGGDNWVTIGDAEGAGINWYNSRNITGEPGGQSNFAWSEEDSGWKDGRFNLDQIPLAFRGEVIFRIAFGSNDDNPSENILDGFAFDDIYIGEKNRNVLVEHFTNASSNVSNQSNIYLDNLYLDEIAAKDSSNFIAIQYHMENPGPDQLNADNPADPIARSLLYGISQPPTTIMDGIQNSYFNGFTANINEEEIDRRALEDPSFAIEIDTIVGPGSSDSEIRLSIRYTYIDSLKPLTTPVTIHAALIERGVPGPAPSIRNGNVVRKLLLQSEGRTFTRSWVHDDYEIARLDYVMDVPVVNPDSLFILAFIQDKPDGTNDQSKRMLQASIIKSNRKKGTTIVGLPDNPIFGELSDLSIYPNPASNYLNLTVGANLKNDYNWKMIDQRGITVLSGELNQDFSAGPQRIDVSGLANGIYFMAIQTGDDSIIYRKIAVMNRN